MSRQPPHGLAAEPSEVGGEAQPAELPRGIGTHPPEDIEIPANTTEVGIDIIKVDRIRAALDRFGERFSRRVLTTREQRYVRNRPETFAGRWAAKEAVSKVLGLGVRGIGWRDIEIARMPTGPPAVSLHGRAVARPDGATAGAARGIRSTGGRLRRRR